MHLLDCPSCSTFPQTPFGRREGIESDSAKLSQWVSSEKTAPQGYPSPPMSDSQSPHRRTSQEGQEERQSDDRNLPQNPGGLERRDVGGEARGLPVVSSAPPHIPQQPIEEGQVRASYGFQQLPSLTSTGVSYPGLPFPQPHPYPYADAPADYTGGQPLGAQAQPAVFASAAPFRPNRPARRTKAHVASACVNCKKAHLSCDVQRPCPRCVAAGKQNSCYDVQHKKRGRPRLRDEREMRTQEPEPPGRQPGTIHPRTPTVGPSPIRHRRAESLRTLRSSQGVTAGEATPPRQENNPTNTAGPSGFASLASSFFPRSEGPTAPVRPVAFLNLDLVILKVNQAFRDAVAPGMELVGEDLARIVDAGYQNDIQRLKQELRQEKERSDPYYMPPINFGGQNEQEAQRQAVEHVTEADYERYCQAYQARSQALAFSFPSSRLQALNVTFRLAKTSLFFVTLAFPPLERQNTLAPAAPVPSGPNRLLPAFVGLPSTSAAEPTRFFSSRPSWATSAPSPPLFSRDLPAAPLLPTAPHTTPFMPPGSRPSEQSYFRSYQSSPVSFTPQSAYGSTSRPPSVTAGSRSRAASLRDSSRPGSRDLYQLSPLTGPPASPLYPPSVDTGGQGRERVRPREPTPQGDEGEQSERPEGSKRRRLDINEMLD